MFLPKNILVPTDFSEYSDKALQTALDIAKQYKSKILYYMWSNNNHSMGLIIFRILDQVENASASALKSNAYALKLENFRIQNQ